MAKKKSKEQLKEERRRAIERKRRETGWQPAPEPDMEQERLMADMIPLLGGAEEGAVPEGVAMALFMEKILDSDELINEPEFDGVYVHPLHCVPVFVQGLQELGLEDLDPEDLPMSEQEDLRADLQEELTMRVLTPEVQEAILSALEDLRERAREEGDKDLMAQAAGVYSFLEDAPADEMWANIGVARAVVGRSLDAGLEMYDVLQEQARQKGAGQGGPGALRRLLGATPQRKLERIINKYPGLADFMVEQLEVDWEEGAHALGSGEIDVGFFSAAEISAAFDEAYAVGLELDEEGDLVHGEGAGEDAGEAFVKRLQSYERELSTPERLAQMQARLDEFSREADPSWLTFFSMLNDAFESGEKADLLHRLLVHALVGEMQNSVRKEAEEE
ncbi:MAG: hypothetical protein P8129_13255 [Anaerolineae bacterium]|jgi:hypothetical protein